MFVDIKIVRKMQLQNMKKIHLSVWYLYGYESGHIDILVWKDAYQNVNNDFFFKVVKIYLIYFFLYDFIYLNFCHSEYIPLL